MAFHTHKKAVEKAIKIAKDSIAEFNYNISKLTNLIENLKQGDI